MKSLFSMLFAGCSLVTCHPSLSLTFVWTFPPAATNSQVFVRLGTNAPVPINDTNCPFNRTNPGMSGVIYWSVTNPPAKPAEKTRHGKP